MRTRSRRAAPTFAMLSSLVLALVMTLALSWTPTVNAASMLAIDYGTDSFKASLVKPGVPFDVLLTREGKRKAPAVVTYRGEERFVGSDAQTLVSVILTIWIEPCSLCIRPRETGHAVPAGHDRIRQVARRTIAFKPAVPTALVSLLKCVCNNSAVISRDPYQQRDRPGRGGARVPTRSRQGARRGASQGERQGRRYHGARVVG